MSPIVSLQARLCKAAEKLRDKEAELDECGRQRDAERQRARELEAQVRRLQNIIGFCGAKGVIYQFGCKMFNA